MGRGPPHFSLSPHQPDQLQGYSSSMFIRASQVLFAASIVVGCGGSTVADRPDVPNTSENPLESPQVEPADSTSPPSDDDAAITTPITEAPVTTTAEAGEAPAATTTTVSPTIPSSTTPSSPTTTLELRDFLTEEPNASSLFLGTVEPDA
jgi:hypothetical protein